MEITDTASRLRRLETEIASLPVIDRPRVEAIHTTIAEGRYQIDTTEVAEKLVDIERSLESK